MDLFLLCIFKAVDLAAMCLDESSKNFKPTNGWIGRFKKRHNINWHKISGEKNSARDGYLLIFERQVQVQVLFIYLRFDQVKVQILL